MGVLYISRWYPAKKNRFLFSNYTFPSSSIHSLNCIHSCALLVSFSTHIYFFGLVSVCFFSHLIALPSLGRCSVCVCPDYTHYPFLGGGAPRILVYVHTRTGAFLWPWLWLSLRTELSLDCIMFVPLPHD